MDYISLKYIREFLAYPSEDLLFEDQRRALEDIEARFKEGKTYKQEKIAFSESALLTYITGLQDKRQVVFDQWIHESKSLSSLLFHKKLLKNDVSEKLQEHFLFREFTSFLSPYVFPDLIRAYEENPSKNAFFAASYVPILNADSKWMLQDKISRHIQSQWSPLGDDQAATLSSEDFNKLVKGLFSNEQMETFNFFTKEFYSQKVSFIEKAMQLFAHKQATYGFVMWLCEQLLKIKLNPEHQDNIQEVLDSLKRGDGEYFKVSHKVQSWTKKKIAVLIAVPLVLVFGIWLLTWQFGAQKVDPVTVGDESAFSHFSKQERMQLDSLIKTMSPSREEGGDLMDQNTSYLHLSPVEIDLEQRDVYKNRKAETFIQDCLKANELKEKNALDSCRIYPEKQVKDLKDNFLKITQHPGSQKMLLKNESHYQVQVLLFEDQASAPVYSAYVQEDETINFKVSPGEHIVFIPGNNLGQAIYPPNSGISSNYKHHFCFMDGNFVPNLMHDYTINSVSEPEIKILLNDNAEAGFYILDIYEGLED